MRLCLKIPYLSFLFILCLPFDASAQSDIDSSRRNAIVRAIEKAAPAVVTINAVEIQRERLIDPFFGDFWDLFEFPPRRPNVRERRRQSIGSGFIFDKAGHILTNAHVLEGAHEVWVTLPDGRELEVEYIGHDSRSDLAVLKAKGSNLPYVSLGDSSSLLVGEWVIAIGNPFGLMMRDRQPSVSVGVVSANHRRVSREIARGERVYQDLVQTDAAINPGNSGGPLVNGVGDVIGVNTIIFSQSGGSVGIGFAIPINYAKNVARELIEFGRRRDPWAGFRVESLRVIRPEVLRQLGITAEEGCLVTEILTRSPAYQAGLREGDVIVAMDGEAVISPIDIDFVTWRRFVGDTITCEVDRLGRRHEFTFKIQELAR